MNIADIHQVFLKCEAVSTDTRKIIPNSLFVALKGDNFDANTFAEQALQKGALNVIIDNPDYYIDARTILVKNSLLALQELATFHRQYLNIPIVALTGSNGKTTTKELIYAVLSQKFKTKATIGNLNNHIGVPLTLLSFDKSTEIGIVEMGANHQKEIAFLCEIAKPNFGYITNFGKAHLEGFGGVEGVIKGKSEMYDYLRINNQLAFVNKNDNLQIEKSNGIPNYSFGVNTIADVLIESISANPFVSIQLNQQKIQTQLIGIYNATNVCAAITIGNYFKVPLDSIKKGLEEYVSDNNRSQIIKKEGFEIILDAYNANPSSMAVAIANFIQLSQPKKVLVLGDMFELGDEAKKEHDSIVASVINNTELNCYFIGKHFYQSKIESNSCLFFENFENFTFYLSTNPIRKDSTILIKGSRGMQLERTLSII